MPNTTSCNTFRKIIKILNLSVFIWGITPVNITYGQWVQIGNKLVGSGAMPLRGLDVHQGVGVCLSGDGQTVAFGGNYDNSWEGATWVFRKSDTGWVQSGKKLVGSGSISYNDVDQGTSVSLSEDGKTLAIGAPGDNNTIGATWVFTLSDTGWVQMGNKLVGIGWEEGTVYKGGQGNSVSLSSDGQTLAVGAPYDNKDQGATWIFSRSKSGWTQIGNKLTDKDIQNYGNSVHQGNSVSLSGSGKILAVGGPRDNMGSGSVWIYNLETSGWVQFGNKLISSVQDGIQQGQSVSLSADGTVLAAGGINYTTIYKIINNTWIETTNLPGSGTTHFVGRGSSVGLSSDGKTLLVGTPEENNGTGGMLVFSSSKGYWDQEANMIGSGFISTSFNKNIKQGFSVSISSDGKSAASGGYGDNNFFGAIWIFENKEIMTTLANPLRESDGTGQIYPNPFKENIKFNAYPSIENYEIFDIEGRTVENGLISASGIGSSLQPGMYQVRLNRTVIKIVKLP